MSSPSVKQIVFIGNQGTFPQNGLPFPKQFIWFRETFPKPFYILSRFPFTSLYTTFSMVQRGTNFNQKTAMLTHSFPSCLTWSKGSLSKSHFTHTSTNPSSHITIVLPYSTQRFTATALLATHLTIPQAKSSFHTVPKLPTWVLLG